MKCIPFLFILFFCAHTSASAQLRLGVKAGLTTTRGENYFGPYDIRTDVVSGRKKMLLSQHAGLIADIRLSRSLYLQPGLQYIGRGAKTARQSSTPPTSSSVPFTGNYDLVERFHNLELPVLLLGRFGKGKRWFAGGGPLAGYGLEGSIDREYHSPRAIEGGAGMFGQGGYYDERVYFGAAATAGYEFTKRWMVLVNCDVVKSGEGGANHGLSLSAGYYFLK